MKRIDFLDSNGFWILEQLVERPFYLRELAEKTGLAPSSVHKVVSKLAGQKMVLVKKQKNRTLLSLNSDSALACRSISLIWINKIVNARSFSKLAGLRPKSVVLFGSAATGKLDNQSDVDLAVWFSGSTNALKLSGIKRELSNELNREVQLIVLSDAKVNALKKEGSELLNQIKNQGLVLWGSFIE